MIGSSVTDRRFDSAGGGGADPRKARTGTCSYAGPSHTPDVSGWLSGGWERPGSRRAIRLAIPRRSATIRYRFPSALAVRGDAMVTKTAAGGASRSVLSRWNSKMSSLNALPALLPNLFPAGQPGRIRGILPRPWPIGQSSIISYLLLTKYRPAAEEQAGFLHSNIWVLRLI